MQTTDHVRRILNLACLICLVVLGACDPVEVEFRSLPTPVPTRTPIPRPTRLPTATPTPPAPVESACSLAELWFDQHISASGSYTETQVQASGPMVCRIEQDSCARNYMVGNLDSSIVFKREEEPPYDQEDILMHPAMLLPLTRLNELVWAEWNGLVQLRITDAYDSLLEHDLNQGDETRKSSLHFEGRALDLTTWPVDQNRYGRLCALAHCAGFDWVHNEGDHCHVSVKAESLCLRCTD